MKMDSQTTIFIIDDDGSVRKSLQRLLQVHEYCVETFENAELYLARKIYTAIGVIILDLNLPGLDGIDLQTRLRAVGSQLPIIFLTGHGDINTSVIAMKQGAENFLTKPVDESILLSTVDEALKHHTKIHQKIHNAGTIQQHLTTLTPREYEVLRYVIYGASNKQIARQLNIAEKTVKVHRGRAKEKMHATSTVMLVRMCDAVDVQPLATSQPQHSRSVES